MTACPRLWPKLPGIRVALVFTPKGLVAVGEDVGISDYPSGVPREIRPLADYNSDGAGLSGWLSGGKL